VAPSSPLGNERNHPQLLEVVKGIQKGRMVEESGAELRCSLRAKQAGELPGANQSDSQTGASQGL